MSDLPEFRARLDRVAAQCPHKEVQSRLETLYEKLQAGQIPEKLQQKLRDFAAQLETKDIRASSVQLQEMITEYWQQHKLWLTGLKWLLRA